MKLFTKSLIVFFTLAVIEISCCVISTCGGCYETAGSTRYRIKNYSLSSYAGSVAISGSNQSVRAAEMRIVLTPTHEFITQISSSFKALYACSPAEPAPTQNILSFKIVSNADFKLANSTIEAGKSLNALFFLENGPNGEGQLETYLQAPNIDASLYEYTLRIFQPIVQTQTHIFEIEIKLSDNQSFTLETLPIVLQP